MSIHPWLKATSFYIPWSKTFHQIFLSIHPWPMTWTPVQTTWSETFPHIFSQWTTIDSDHLVRNLSPSLSVNAPLTSDHPSTNHFCRGFRVVFNQVKRGLTSHQGWPPTKADHPPRLITHQGWPPTKAHHPPRLTTHQGLSLIHIWRCRRWP